MNGEEGEAGTGDDKDEEEEVDDEGKITKGSLLPLTVLLGAFWNREDEGEEITTGSEVEVTEEEGREGLLEIGTVVVAETEDNSVRGTPNSVVVSPELTDDAEEDG